MIEQRGPKYPKWFHNFMIFFFLWAFAAFAVLFGIRFIWDGWENGYSGFPFVMLIVVNVLLIGVGLFAVKVRFDMAAYREKAPLEVLILCLAAAALCLANYWVEDIAGDDYQRRLLTPEGILVLWGIGVYRYLRSVPDVFVN